MHSSEKNLRHQLLIGPATVVVLFFGLAGYQAVVPDASHTFMITLTLLLAALASVVSLYVARSASAITGRTVAALSNASGNLGSWGQKMSTDAESTATQANAVLAGAEQVTQSLQTVSAGIEQMNASIKEIARSASEAARIATTAVEVAKATNVTVAELGDSSAEIGNVLKVINSIAEQTNLLALNATIEAARAGEAGKGFAVVANEVKELAKGTSKATEEIRGKIEAIQSKTTKAVAAIGDIRTIIGQIHSFQSTAAAAVEEQTATTSEMVRSLEDATFQSANISRSIAGVAQAAQATTAGASDGAQEVVKLAALAADLERLVGHSPAIRQELQ